jgi:hypothetical protein
VNKSGAEETEQVERGSKEIGKAIIPDSVTVIRYRRVEGRNVSSLQRVRNNRANPLSLLSDIARDAMRFYL